MRVAVTDSEYGDIDIEREVLEAAGHTVEYLGARTEAEVAASARGFEAIVVQYAPITSRVLAALPGLRVVSRYGTGVDNIDLTAASAAGVTVCNVPRYGSDEVAAHAITMALASVRGLAVAADARREGVWPPSDTTLPERPGDLALGIVGLGHIGRTVHEMGRPLFGSVHWFDPYFPGEAEGPTGRCASLRELAAVSNVITVHVPLVDQTRGIIDLAVIEAMPEPRYLVNVARGGIAVEDDIATALEAGILRGAALDVFVDEPPAPTSRIMRSAGLLATPHSAWASPGALRSVRRIAAENVVSAFEGAPQNRVSG